MNMKLLEKLLELLIKRLPFSKWYNKIKLYCRENVDIRCQLRRGKRTEPDPITGLIWETLRNGTKNGPYCPECWYQRKSRILLIPTSSYNVYRCNSHNSYVRPANYKEPKQVNPLENYW
jgi:hypothetical protein